MAIDIVLVDRDDNVLGYKEKVEAHKHPVPLHRAVSVIIYDKDHKEMLLQKRSSGKPTWPGYWSNAACTHPLSGESYKDAAERRLFEEMGVKTDLNEVYKFIYKAKYDSVWGEHELDAVFTGEYDGKVDPDPNEADGYKWMNIGKLKADVTVNPNLYTPWFKMILQKLH